jgi:hypothetical protein
MSLKDQELIHLINFSENVPAIRKVCQQFVALCRNMDLLDGGVDRY